VRPSFESPFSKARRACNRSIRTRTREVVEREEGPKLPATIASEAGIGIRFNGFFWLTASILRAASSAPPAAATARPAAVSAKDLDPPRQHLRHGGCDRSLPEEIKQGPGLS
jgi:hypothetical protein